MYEQNTHAQLYLIADYAAEYKDRITNEAYGEAWKQTWTYKDFRIDLVRLLDKHTHDNQREGIH